MMPAAIIDHHCCGQNLSRRKVRENFSKQNCRKLEILLLETLDHATGIFETWNIGNASVVTAIVATLIFATRNFSTGNFSLELVLFERGSLRPASNGLSFGLGISGRTKAPASHQPSDSLSDSNNLARIIRPKLTHLARRIEIPGSQANKKFKMLSLSLSIKSL